MARENHPRTRQAAKLKRKQGTRDSFDRLLLVCEGKKTEPLYFNEIKKEHRIPNANITFHHDHTNPLRIVEDAEDIFLNGKHNIQKKAFEHVCMVFDRDEHDYYHQALEKAQALNAKGLRNDLRRKVTFTAYPSIPCFELWLLLHFENIQAPLHRDVALEHLKQHLVNYEKGDANTYKNTKANLPTAIERATRICQQRGPLDDQGPFSNVHELIQLLTNLKN